MLKYLSGLRLFADELVEFILGECHVPDDFGGPRGLLPRVHEHEYLVLAGPFDYLLVAHLIHEHESFDRLFLGHANVYLLERHRPE